MFLIGDKDAAKLRRNSGKKSKANRPKSETSLHWHVAGLLNKHLAPPAWWTTFPAGGGGEMRGKILKSMGLKAGVPDILIIVPQWGDLPSDPAMVRQMLYWIELKREGRGQPSEAQIKTQAELTAMGCRVANCDTIEAVKAALAEWQVPYRASSERQHKMHIALTNLFAND